MPVHDRSTGKFAYYVQADDTDAPVIAEDPSGLFTTYVAMEDFAESEEQAYYVGADGQYYPYN